MDSGTITTIVFALLALVVLGLGLAVPGNYNVIRPNERGFTYAFGKVTSFRGPGPTLTWPWENLIIRPINQQKVDIELSRLTTGAPDPMEFDLTMSALIHVSDVEKSVFGFQGNFKQALDDLAQGAIQAALVRVGGNALLDNTLPRVLEQATNTITKHVTDKWGITVDELVIADIGLPQVLIDATAIRAKSKAEAEALTNLSKAEAENYQRELTAQGRNYRFHQLMDTLEKMAKGGAFRAVGDLNSVLGMVLVDDNKEDVA